MICMRALLEGKERQVRWSDSITKVFIRDGGGLCRAARGGLALIRGIRLIQGNGGKRGYCPAVADPGIVQN